MIRGMSTLLELYVVCRRACPLPPARDGLQVSALPRIYFRTYLASLPEPEAPAAILQLNAATPAHVAALEALARACADASGGVVLRYLLVTAPARFEIIYEAPPAGAPELPTHGGKAAR